MKLKQTNVPPKKLGVLTELCLEFVESSLSEALLVAEKGDPSRTPYTLYTSAMSAIRRNPLLYGKVRVELRGANVYLSKDTIDVDSDDVEENVTLKTIANKPFVSIRKAAELSGISIYAWRQMVAAKAVPYIRSGNKYLIDYDAAMSWVRDSMFEDIASGVDKNAE